MEVFIWTPWRSDRNSQRQYNMKQLSAGQSVARVRLGYFGSGTSALILEPFQLALSLIKGSNRFILKMGNYSTNYIKMASKTSAVKFCWVVDIVGFLAKLHRFLGKHADKIFFTFSARLTFHFVDFEQPWRFNTSNLHSCIYQYLIYADKPAKNLFSLLI